MDQHDSNGKSLNDVINALNSLEKNQELFFSKIYHTMNSIKVRLDVVEESIKKNKMQNNALRYQLKLLEKKK